MLPHISNCIADWQSNHDDEDPDSYFNLLESALTDYREALSADIESVAFIDAGLKEIKKIIEDMRSKLPEELKDEDFFRDSPGGGSSDDSRSIFDDVDL